MVEIAYAPPEARAEIAQFMRDVFPRAKWSMEGWRALLDGRWSGPTGRYAISVRDKGALVGVLGMVTADRPLGTRTGITANMTSWYLLKSHRGAGIGQEMVRFALADPEVTVTDFTSSRGAIRTVLEAGLSELDTHRRIWHGRSTACPLRVIRSPLDDTPDLTPAERRVLADHSGLAPTQIAVETPDGPVAMILLIKPKTDTLTRYDALYIGNRSRFARHARAIVDSILPGPGTLLSVDSRHLPAEIDADESEAFDVPRFYGPGRADPAEIDLAYSEIALLNMKIY